MFFATNITIWLSFSSSPSPFIWYFLGVPRPGAMEPDCLVPGRTFPANPRSSSVQRQPACRHLPRTSHQTKILLSKQNLLFNSSHYSPGMHLPAPSIDMQQRQRPEKNLKKSCAILWQCALCISLNWWRRSKCLWLSFERFLYMQTTLEIKQTETMIGIALKKKATMGKLQLGDKIWNFSLFSEFMTIFRENVTFTF